MEKPETNSKEMIQFLNLMFWKGRVESLPRESASGFERKRCIKIVLSSSEEKCIERSRYLFDELFGLKPLETSKYGEREVVLKVFSDKLFRFLKEEIDFTEKLG